MKFMNIIFGLLLITSLGFVKQIHTAEQDPSAEAKHLRELCTNQDQHQNAINLINHNSVESYVNIPDKFGRTALHNVSVFLWAPNKALPDCYGQGQTILSDKATRARDLAKLLIRKGAVNCKDQAERDCISLAGTAWVESLPAPVLPDPDNCPDISPPYASELQATRDWLARQLN